ncbi:MAG: helix-turn-helix domain-containing protein [Hyphomicrobiales bacterium]|nr:MAG: helix-turn-helix domain-containing protein [Hyphomicrobiales bacterium]
MLTPEQLRAARAMLSWTRQDLAKRSGVFVNTIKRFEVGESDPKLSTLYSLKRAVEAAGIEFIDDGKVATEGTGPGLRLRGSPKRK